MCQWTHLSYSCTKHWGSSPKGSIGTLVDALFAVYRAPQVIKEVEERRPQTCSTILSSREIIEVSCNVKNISIMIVDCEVIETDHSNIEIPNAIFFTIARDLNRLVPPMTKGMMFLTLPPNWSILKGDSFSDHLYLVTDQIYFHPEDGALTFGFRGSKHLSFLTTSRSILYKTLSLFFCQARFLTYSQLMAFSP